MTAKTINFTVPWFTDLIMTGEKTQTVRNRDIINSNEWVRLTTGARTKKYKVLLYAPVLHSFPIDIYRNKYTIDYGNEKFLCKDKKPKNQFAKNDGFLSWELFIFTLCELHHIKYNVLEDVPLFEGIVIHWDYDKRIYPEDWSKK